MMVCKEFNLSECEVSMEIGVRTNIPNIDKKVDIVAGDYFKLEDVKEFIRLLKEEIIGEEFEYYEHSVEWLKEIIDKLAGEKLI